jgi:RHS repeat-associated protein
MNSSVRVRALLAGALFGCAIIFPAFSDPEQLSRLFPGALIGDLNGDGIADAVVQPPAPHANGSTYAGSATGAPRRIQTLPPTLFGITLDQIGTDLHVGDFDGDGHDDVYAQPVDPAGTHAILIANANGVLGGLSEAFSSPHLGLDWSAAASRITVGDFDGDSRDELIIQGIGENSPVTVVVTDNLGQFVAGTQSWVDGYLGRHWNATDTSLFAGDFDGDGRSDLLVQVRDDLLTFAPHHESAYAVALADRDGRFTRIDQSWDKDAFEADWDPKKYDLRIQDVDGDGIADFALIAKTHGGTNQLLLGTKSGSPSRVAVRWKGDATPAEAFARSQASFAAAQAALKRGDETVTLAAKTPVPVRMQSFTPGTLAIGAVNGEASTSGGVAGYSIPIVVPPGRAGMQPSVSVSYSSQGGNGPLGMGWSLGVGSAISRCSQMAAISGESNIGVRLTNTDRLCLDGQRLILVSGTYGENGAVYRTETESFVRVEQTSSFLTNSSKFLVRHADGRIAFYGYDTQSLFGNATMPITWLLTRVEDTATNSLIYTYDRTVASEAPLLNIKYTGRGTTAGDRAVNFIYEARNDVSSSYIVGIKQTQTRRIQKITTSVGGGIYREYRFTYKSGDSAATGRALLTSVEECATVGTLYCLPPTSFTWQEPASTFSGEARVNVATDPQTSPIQILMNYDPSQTLVPAPYAIEPGASFLGKGQKELWYQSADFVTMLRADASSITDVGGTVTWPKIDGGFWEYQPDIRDKYYDFNNDGRTDFFNGASVLMSDINGTWTLSYITVEGSAGFSGSDWKLGDFTGDGFPDIVVLDVDGQNNRRIWLYRNTGAAGGLTFAARVEIANPPEVPTNFMCGVYPFQYVCAVSNDGAELSRVIDIDGDGRLDILYKSYDNLDQPGPLDKVVLNRYGESSTWPIVSSPSNNPEKIYLWGDANGDGLEDVFESDAGSAASDPNYNGTWYVRFNQGGTATNPVNFGTALGVSGNGIARYATRLADIDNDGRVEFVVAEARVHQICMGDVYWINYDDTDFPYGAQMHGALCGGQLIKNIPEYTKFDASIYRFKALRFVQGAGGTLSVVDTGARFHAPGTGFSVGDANGDGLSDITWSVNRNYQMYYNDDCQFPAQCTYFPTSNVTTYGNYQNVATQGAPDLMTAVEDGLNRRSEWTYAPLSAGTTALANAGHALSGGEKFYDITDADGFLDADHFYYTSTTYAVARFRNKHFGNCDAGAPGCDPTWRTRTFGYRDALFNNKGRGLRGFAKTIDEDRDRGVKTVTTYKQIFPFGGQVDVTTTTLTSNGVVIATTTNDWAGSVQGFDANMNPVAYPGASAKTVTVRPEKATTVSRDPISNTEISRTIVDPTYAGVCTMSTTEIVSDPNFGSGDVNGDGFVDRTQNVVSVTNNAPNFGSTWQFCQANARTTSKTMWTAARYSQTASSSTQVMVESLTYNARRQVLTTNFEPQGSGGTLKRITTYGYSDTAGAADYGNVRTVTLSGGLGATAVANRITTTVWSGDGYFPYQVTNPVGLTTTFSTSTRHGAPMSITGPDGLATIYSQDAFGRQVQITPAASSYKYSSYASASQPTNAKYSITTTQPGQPTTVVTYDAFNRVLRTATQGFDGVYTQVDAQYDAYGRIRNQTEPYLAGGAASHSTSFSYDLLGRQSSSTDAKNLVTSMVYNGTLVQVSATADGIVQNSKQEKDVLGLLMTTEDHYGNRTHFRYDAAKNPVRIVDAIGSVVTTVYNGLAQKTTLNDPDFGQWVYTYNVLGELLTQRDARLKTSTFTYDLAGRMLTRLEPETAGNCTATWTYGNASSGTAAGKLVNVAMSGAGCDSNGYREDYQYDSKGRPSTTFTTLGSGGTVAEFTTTYDSLGRVDTLWYPSKNSTSTTVPNMPENVVATPEYNTEGNTTLTWAPPIGGPAPTSYKLFKSRNGGAWTTITVAPNVFSNQYTGLLTGSYEFKAQACIAAVCSVDSDPVYVEIDSSGGMKASGPQLGNFTARTLLGGDSRWAGSFDGRRSRKDRRGDVVMAKVDPARFGVKQVYNANGYLSQVQNAQNAVPYWTANAVNVYGAVSQETAGNGRLTSRSYKPGTPFVQTITTGGGTVQNLEYSWNGFGQLLYRKDVTQSNLTESFGYDFLNRVTSGTLSIGPTTTFAASYDASGNITSKTDTAGTRNYVYPAPVEGTFNRPHGVTSSGGVGYGYDANGNMTTRGGATQAFNVANLPTSLTANGYTSTFVYSPSRTRYKQVAGYSGRTETTFYVGSLFERFTKTGSSTTEYRYQVTAGGMPVARVTEYSTGISRTQYLHRDHLGSVDVITEGTVGNPNYANAIARMSFDAHGSRRASDSSQGSPWLTQLAYATSSAWLDGLRDKTTRGFTDHEMLDNVGLIHMNGRVYDPKLGRFLSVDPVFQIPTNTQGMNPYSYVLNSPLSLTDPTGFVPDGDGIYSDPAVEGRWLLMHAIDDAISRNRRNSVMLQIRGSRWYLANVTIPALRDSASIEGLSPEAQGMLARVSGLQDGNLAFMSAIYGSPAAKSGATASERAKTLAELSDCVADSKCTGKGGFKRLTDEQLVQKKLNPKDFRDNDSGFNAALFENGEGEYVLAFEGTHDLKDVGTDLLNAFGIRTSQYDSAVGLGKSVRLALGDNLTMTGHSLGGGLASVAALAADTNGVTFNAAGVTQGTLRRYGIKASKDEQRQQITAYKSGGDLLTAFQAISPFPDAIGTTVMVKGGGAHSLSPLCTAMGTSC